MSATRSGDDHSPSMYASPMPISPWRSMRRATDSSWTWNSRAALGCRVAEHAPAPVGQHHGQAAHRDPRRGGEPGADRQRGQRAVGEPRDRAGSVPALTGPPPACSPRPLRPPRRGAGTARPGATAASACTWMSAMVRWVMSGWRSSRRSTIRSLRRRRREHEAGGDDGGVVLALVDRDPQARRVVLHVHGVAALHVDERRDVEVLVHRGDERAVRAPRGRRVYRCRSRCVLCTSTTTTRKSPAASRHR